MLRFVARAQDPTKQPPAVKRRIVVEKAAFLVNADIMGKSDPYCKGEHSST